MADPPAVQVLQAQMQALSKDIGRLEKALENHELAHRTEAAARTSARRWAVTALLAAVAAVDGPILGILAAHVH